VLDELGDIYQAVRGRKAFKSANKEYENLFDVIETQETNEGIALFSIVSGDANAKGISVAEAKRIAN